MCLIAIPYCNLNFWQPPLQFVNIGDGLGETLLIQEKVNSLDPPSFGSIDALALT